MRTCRISIVIKPIYVELSSVKISGSYGSFHTESKYKVCIIYLPARFLSVLLKDVKFYNNKYINEFIII